MESDYQNYINYFYNDNLGTDKHLMAELDNMREDERKIVEKDICYKLINDDYRVLSFIDNIKYFDVYKILEQKLELLRGKTFQEDVIKFIRVSLALYKKKKSDKYLDDIVEFAFFPRCTDVILSSLFDNPKNLTLKGIQLLRKIVVSSVNVDARKTAFLELLVMADLIPEFSDYEQYSDYVNKIIKSGPNLEIYNFLQCDVIPRIENKMK